MAFFEFIPLDFVDEAIFTISRKGKSKLIYEGYGYVNRSSHGSSNGCGVTNWRCELFGGCKGKAVTKIIGSKQFVESNGTHNHLPNHGSKKQYQSKLINKL